MDVILQASDLHFAYGDQPVLRGINIALRGGEVVALLGPNGTGKSTLLKILLGQLRAQGVVLWNSKPVQRWKSRELARLVAYLPQTPAFEPSQRIAQTLRMGRTPYWGAFGVETQRDIDAVAAVVELLQLGDLLHRRMDQISGGQRQRVFLGRCLVQEPQALLLDEPSTHLDLRHQVELCALLRRLADQRRLAVLMASHELNLAASFADRLVLLESGRAAADGSPKQVMDAELLSRVFGVRLRRVDAPDLPPLIAAEAQSRAADSGKP
jgi:iron complex transport system ATP-binding protein